MPNHLTEHLHSVFNTVQIPPSFHPKYRLPISLNQSAANFKNQQRHTKNSAAAATYVTVPFLNSLYNIPSNIGSADQSQSVFETNLESFSQSDLSLFQRQYGIPLQAAEDKYNMASAQCTTATCAEGNLDIQYLMGIAQKTRTIYWYSPNTADPFVSWILDVSSTPNPPLSNSISWGSVEQVIHLIYFIPNHSFKFARPIVHM